MTRIAYIAPEKHGGSWQMPTVYHTRPDCYSHLGQWRIPTAEDVVMERMTQCRACRVSEAKSA